MSDPSLPRAAAVNKSEVASALQREALRLGFTSVGIAAAVQPTGLGHFHDWLAAGYAGEMSYLETRRTAYGHPARVLPAARSLVMLAVNYNAPAETTPAPGRGRVARYAWGDDYHDVIRERLNRLAAFLTELVPGACARGVVDTAPLLEREFAQLAGLGWVGKNTMLIHPSLGSYFFLAALVTDVELAYDEASVADHCGACTACLDACPTGAFVEARVLDSRRCISYLTIELKEAIPRELREQVGDWLFGCDVCQDVCPWNGRAPASLASEHEPKQGTSLDLAELFYLTDDEFRRRFRRTPLWRPKRRGVLRNAAIVLGNQRHKAALPALAQGLRDVEPLVRGACAWALGRLNLEAAREALAAALDGEGDPLVRAEIERALGK